MQADLQFQNGTTANIAEGAWLHHIVLLNNDKANNGMGTLEGKHDLVCTGQKSVFGNVYPQRIFASGNERTSIRLNNHFKYGMAVDAKDQFNLIYDLVNQNNVPQTYYIAMVCGHTV